MEKLIERETRDGKPYGGVWFMRSTYISFTAHPIENDPEYREIVAMLQEPIEGLEFRNGQIILKTPCFKFFKDPLNQKIPICFKFVLWGRAFKVRRYLQNHSKKNRLFWLNGRETKVFC